MSSCITLRRHPPVNLSEWEAFCREFEVLRAPDELGGNVYYHGSDVEIIFGAVDLPNHDGPPKEAVSITFGCGWYTDLSSLAYLACSAARVLNAVLVSYDPIVEPYIETAVRPERIIADLREQLAQITTQWLPAERAPQREHP